MIDADILLGYIGIVVLVSLIVFFVAWLCSGESEPPYFMPFRYSQKYRDWDMQILVQDDVFKAVAISGSQFFVETGDSFEDVLPRLLEKIDRYMLFRPVTSFTPKEDN